MYVDRGSDEFYFFRAWLAHRRRGLRKALWDESKHPRDIFGRFAANRAGPVGDAIIDFARELEHLPPGRSVTPSGGRRLRSALHGLVSSLGIRPMPATRLHKTVRVRQGRRGSHSTDGDLVLPVVAVERAKLYIEGTTTDATARSLGLIVHEAVHQYTRLPGATGEKDPLGKAVEEATTQLITERLLERHFHMPEAQRQQSRYIGLTDILEGALAKQGGLSRRVSRAKLYRAARDMLMKASVRSRRGGPARDGADYLRSLAAELDVSSTARDGFIDAVAGPLAAEGSRKG